MLRVSIAAHSGVRPYQSAAWMSAPCSIRKRATSSAVVDDRHDQRRDRVGVGLIDVRLRRQQQLRRLEPAVARRVEQRRQRPGNRLPRPARRQAAADDADAVTEAGNRVRQHPLRRLPGSRLRVHVGAALDQQLDDRRMVFADGHHQRRLLISRVAARRPPRRARAALARRRARRHATRSSASSRAAGSTAFGIGARVEQQPHASPGCRCDAPASAASRRSGSPAWRRRRRTSSSRARSTSSSADGPVEARACPARRGR